MQIYPHFVEHVCMELWFIWECSSIVRYVEHGVSFSNPYAPMTSETETFFMDDYLFCKISLLFFDSVLVLPYYCLEIILKVLRSKYAKKIRFNIEQVSLSNKFFKHIKNFTLILFQNTIS